MRLMNTEQSFFNAADSFVGIPGITLDNMKLIIDIAAGMIIKLSSNDSEIMKKSMAVPFNGLVGTTNETVIIGFETDKANRHLAEFRTLAAIYETKEEVLQHLNAVSLAIFGNTLNSYLEIDKEKLLNVKNSFDKVNFSNDKFAVKLFLEKYKDGLDIAVAELIIELLLKTEEYYKRILLEEQKAMIINPIFKAKNISIDEKMIFCALPFNNPRIEIFDEVIKPFIEKEFEMNVLRSGNIFAPNLNIVESIWTYINQAAIVIIDLSEKNPNVFYELGICHTLGKQVILICDQESLESDYNGKLPFDIGHFNTIFYRNKGNGMEDLKKAIKLNIQATIDRKAILI